MKETPPTPSREIDILPNGHEQAQLTANVSSSADAWEMTGTSVISRDITAGNEFEMSVADMTEILRVGFANAPVGLGLFRLDRTAFQVNRALCELLGYAESELLATNFRDLVHPEDVGHSVATVDRVLADEGDAYSLEQRYIRKDGQVIWLHVTGSLVRDDEGTPRYFASQMVDITEGKEAEIERAATHQRTSQVLERITDGFYALDREWRFTYVNEAAEVMLGRTREELLGQNVWAAFPEAVDNPVYASYQQAMAEGVTTTVEFFFPPLDTWFEARAYPSPDGLSVFFRDVTASKRVVDALKESEEGLRTIVDLMPAVLYILAADEAQTALYFSPRFEALTGYTAKEAMTRPPGWHWLETIHPDDRACVAEEDARTVAAGEPLRIEYRYQRKDGSYVWVLDECVPAHDASGKIIAWHGMLLDISERVQAEESLRESEARFRAFWDATPDAIAVSDPEGIVLAANHAYGALYGYPLEAVIGQPFSIIFPEAEREGANEQYRQTILDQQASLSHETTVRRADGTQSVVEAQASFIVIDGQRQAMISSIRDVTDRARLEGELRSSEEKFRSLVDQLPAVVYNLSADDIQTPMYYSPYIQTLLGYSPEEAVARDRHWLEHVHPGDRERVAAADAHTVTTGAPLRIEYRYLHKDGHYVWVLDDSVAIRDESGAIVAWQGVILDISERVQAEEERTHLASIVESAEDGILSCTLDGTITSWNYGAEKLFGYRIDEAIGRDVAMLRPPELVDDITVLMAGVRQGESIEGHETERMTKDGRRVHISLSISPIRDVNGSITGIASISHDLTALRETEAALRLRDRALAAATNGILITDATLPGNPIVDVNPAFERLTGYQRDEVLGHNCRFLQGTETDPEAVRRLRDAIAAGQDVTETLLNYRQDGSPFWNELHIAAVRDSAGHLTHFVGIQTDVSERIAAEAALRASEAWFRGIWENTLDAMSLTDRDGIVLAINPAYTDLYGFPAAAVVGRHFSIIYPEAERAELAVANRALFAQEVLPPTFESTIQRADGGIRETEIRISFIEGEGIRHVMVAAIRDVTDRKRLENDLRQALQDAQAAAYSKSLFLAMMSHELRTPLQAVLGYADFLLLGPEDSLTSEQKADVGYIHDGAVRMMTLIDDLLDLSRMEAGQMPLVQEPVDLAVIIEQVRQDIAPQVGAKGLDLHIDIPPALPPVSGGPTRVRQILLNLAANAVKFTEVGSIQITARQAGEEIQIVVSDTGIGIAAEAVPSIFEEFHQVDGSMTRRHGGAGLGLAIAQRLAKQMGGAISVESQPGASSAFTLHLPKAVDAEGQA